MSAIQQELQHLRTIIDRPHQVAPRSAKAYNDLLYKAEGLTEVLNLRLPVGVAQCEESVADFAINWSYSMASGDCCYGATFQ